MPTTYHLFNFKAVDPSWHACLNQALEKMEPLYLEKLLTNQEWLPGLNNIFNAFSLPVNKVNYILLGESPYPRAQSANGYAFWDSAVHEIWSEQGLSKPVNRATSLRNIIKMLLIAENLLKPNETHQEAIALLNKENLVQTNEELFTNFIQHGFLLLNASLVLQSTTVRKDALAWQPFLKHILHFLFETNPQGQLILLGNIANTIDKIINSSSIKKLYAEHPYNVTFITNPSIIQFFHPLHLLHKKLDK